jgi:hypothetical protein
MGKSFFAQKLGNFLQESLRERGVFPEVENSHGSLS